MRKEPSLSAAPLRVIVSHPARQGNIYYRPLAAEQMGAEITFLTGLYYRPERFPYSLVRYLTRERKNGIEAQLEKRRIEGLSPENVVSLMGPLLEMTLRPMGKLQAWGAVHDLLASIWLTLNVRATRPTVLHTFQGSSYRTLRAARSRQIARIMEVTLPPAPGTPEDSRLGDNNIVGLRREAMESDFVLVQSEYSARCVVGLGVRPERIIRCHLGVDTARFHPRTVSRKPGPPRVLFLGGASIRKGVNTLLDAWKDLESDAELILAGNRTAGLGQLPGNIRNCRVLGCVTDTQFVELLQDSDILVHPSVAEGGCNVVYEALACGLPTIVSTNATSAVRDGVDGMVFPVGNVLALKAALNQMCADASLRARMAESSRQRALSLNWDSYVIRLADIYRSLAQHTRTQSLEPVQALAALSF